MVHDDRPHAHKAAVSNGTSVDHTPVADSGAMADGQGNAFIRVAHAQILDICFVTNGDRVQISPDDRLEPDGRIFADADIAMDPPSYRAMVVISLPNISMPVVSISMNAVVFLKESIKNTCKE
jgi:hypothetical protein